MSEVVAVCKFVNLIFLISTPEGSWLIPSANIGWAVSTSYSLLLFAWTWARLIRNILGRLVEKYYPPLAGKRRVKWGLSTLNWFSPEEHIEYVEMGLQTWIILIFPLCCKERSKYWCFSWAFRKIRRCSQCSSSFQSFPSGNTFNSCPLPKSQILTVPEHTEKRVYKQKTFLGGMAFISEKINLIESFLQQFILSLFPIETDTWVSLALLCTKYISVYFHCHRLIKNEQDQAMSWNLWTYSLKFPDSPVWVSCLHWVFSAFIIPTLSSLLNTLQYLSI